MALKDLLSRSDGKGKGREANPWAGQGTGPRIEENIYQEIKAKIHYKLLDMIDLASLEQMLDGQRVAEVPRLIEQILQAEATPLNLVERTRIITEVQHE